MVSPESFLSRMVSRLYKIAIRQFSRSGIQQAGYKSASQIMAWCADNFPAEKANFHYLRILRRTGKLKAQLSQKFELSDYQTQIHHAPGRARGVGMFLLTPNQLQHGYHKRKPRLFRWLLWRHH